MDNLLTLFTGLAAIGGLSGIGALFYVASTKRKLDAEARKVGIDGAAVLSGSAIERMQLAEAKADRADVKAQACRVELDALRDHVDQLERLMRDAGLEPPPFVWPLTPAEGRS